MKDGNHTYCDACWALVLDRGWLDPTELCDTCFSADRDAAIVYVDEHDLNEHLMHELG